MDHMKAQGPFPTSYDCSKAKKEIDRAIVIHQGLRLSISEWVAFIVSNSSSSHPRRTRIFNNNNGIGLRIVIKSA